MRCLISLSMLLASLAGGAAQAVEPPLRIGTLEDAALAAPANELLREAYARIGQPVEFLPLPLRRAAVMLKEGGLDGDFMRTPVFFELNPELVKVQIPLRHVAYWVHSRPPCARAIELPELARSVVAHQRGVTIVETQLPPEARLAMDSGAEVLLALRSGRAKHSVVAMTQVMLKAAAQEYPELCRYRLPLFSVDFFHALAPRQAALKPRLEAALRAMQRDGFTAAHWARVDGEFGRWGAGDRAARPPR